MLKGALLSATLFTLAGTATATTLNEAVFTALENHPSITIAEENRNAIKEEWVQAKSGYLPTVDLTIGSGHERSNNTTTRARTADEDHRSLWRNEARLKLTQMVYDGFETENNICQQRSRYESASDNIAEIKETTALNAVQAYLDVQRTQELVALSETNLKSHREYLAQIKKRSSSGRGNQADVRQAEGRLALAEANHFSAKGDLRNAQTAYREIVGSTPEALKNVSLQGIVLPKSEEDFMMRAMENNPAILSAQHDIKAVSSAVKATKAAFHPHLDLELEAARQHNLDGTKEMNNEYLAMARINYNLYRGGSDVARKREQTARLEEARSTLERDRREVEERVAATWNDLEVAKMRLKPLNSHVTSSNQTRRAYKQQFDIGQRSLLDLLDSEIEFFNAKNAQINGKYAIKFETYEVLATSGDLVATLNNQEK